MSAENLACQREGLRKPCEEEDVSGGELDPSHLSLSSVDQDPQVSSPPISSSPSADQLPPAEDCCVVILEDVEDGAQPVAIPIPEPVEQPVKDSSPPSQRGSCRDHVAAPVTFAALMAAGWILYKLYYFLPLDAPAYPDIGSRLAFALRSLSVAGIPILLGISCRSTAAWSRYLLDRLCARPRTTLPCRVSVASSGEQFAIFGLNLMVTATFLPEEHLRLVPFLAGVFAFSRVYDWAAGRLCSAFRGFGTGLAVSPSLFMAGYNLYCLYHLGLSFLLTPAPSGDARPTAAPVPPAGGN